MKFRTHLKYRHVKLMAKLFVAAYITAALALVLVFRRLEVFPLFSWLLFSSIRTHNSHVTAQITEINGGAIDPPLDLMQAGLSDGERIRAFTVLQDIGLALSEKRPDLLAQRRRLLERAYLHRIGSQVRYEIGRRSFDPLVRWKTGESQYESIAEFSTRQDGSN